SPPARSPPAPRRTACCGTAWRTTAAGTCTGRSRPSGADLRMDRADALGGAALALLGRADQDGDLAQVLVLHHPLVRLADPLEAHRTPEHRADLALVDELVGLVALVRVGEVRADDLLLPHPQVADIEVEVVARCAGADHDLAERLDGQDRGRERGLADVL